MKVLLIIIILIQIILWISISLYDINHSYILILPMIQIGLYYFMYVYYDL